MLEIFAQVTAWHWLILAIVLLALEALGIGGFFLGMAVAGLVTAICAWLNMHWGWQFVVFGSLSVLLSYLYWKYFKNFNDARRDTPQLNNRLATMVGKYGTVVSVISNSKVKAKFGDTLWICQTETQLEENQKVQVTAYEDTVLKVVHVD